MYITSLSKSKTFPKPLMALSRSTALRRWVALNQLVISTIFELPLIPCILPNKPSAWHSTFHFAGKQINLPLQESCCVFPHLFSQKLFEDGWCLARLLWAARWSCIRTLNYSAIPEQIEAVMCKTTWLASSCAGEHQPTRCYQVTQRHTEISLMHSLGRAHNLLQRWREFSSDHTECVMISQRRMRIINYSPDPAFMCECWAYSGTGTSRNKQLSALIDTLYLFVPFSNASH